MPTPKQHARGVLKSLRSLITDLQAAREEGVALEFLDQGSSPDAQVTFYLNNLQPLVDLVPEDIGVLARITTTVTVSSTEPDAVA